MTMRLAAIAFALTLLNAGVAFAQSPVPDSVRSSSLTRAQEIEINRRLAVARGLVAQYQTALIRERRLADERESQLIVQHEDRIRSLRQLYEAGAANVLPELVEARDAYAAYVQPIAARDSDVRQLVQGYEAQLTADMAQLSPEQVAALQRFADGDQEEGFRQFRSESARRSAARERAAQAAAIAARLADAADARQLASMAETMRLQGRVPDSEVLALWDRAVQLDPVEPQAHVGRAVLFRSTCNLIRARAAAYQARALAVLAPERPTAVNSFLTATVILFEEAASQEQPARALSLSIDRADLYRGEIYGRRYRDLSYWELAQRLDAVEQEFNLSPRCATFEMQPLSPENQAAAGIDLAAVVSLARAEVARLGAVEHGDVTESLQLARWQRWLADALVEIERAAYADDDFSVTLIQPDVYWEALRLYETSAATLRALTIRGEVGRLMAEVASAYEHAWRHRESRSGQYRQIAQELTRLEELPRDGADSRYDLYWYLPGRIFLAATSSRP